jgi:hypothetical protein
MKELQGRQGRQLRRQRWRKRPRRLRLSLHRSARRLRRRILSNDAFAVVIS